MLTADSAKAGVAAEDKDKVKILALGESTTDEDMAKESNSKSWPSQLEELMLKRGFNVRVYNAAKAGTNTYFILRDLVSNLDLYNPDIVISMMGINDSAGMGSFQDEIFNHFRIYRLIKWYLFFRPQLSEDKKLPLSDFKGEPEKLALKIESGQANFGSVKERVSELGLAAHGIFQFYEGLVFRLVFRSQLSEKNYVIVNELVDAALATGFYGYDLILSKIYIDGRVNAEKSCIDFMLKMVELHNYQFSEEQISISLFCRSNNSSQESQWNKLIKGQKNEIRFSTLNDREVTKLHFLKIARHLASRKVRFFVMGYPTRAIDSVKVFFDGQKSDGVTFVSNQENFTAALREKRYDEIFSDKFAGDFGHATELGNRLIAENIAAHLTEFLRSTK